MTDKFFSQPDCDRCSENILEQSKKLGGQHAVRKMSWFTEECLCEICIDKEKELRSKLEGKGINVSDLEGCGYLPNAGEL